MVRVRNPSSNQVTYTRRLDFDEANDVTFREIGLMFCPVPGKCHGVENGPDIATSLFARGVFGTPWSKNDQQVVDVDYTLTVV